MNRETGSCGLPRVRVRGGGVTGGTLGLLSTGFTGFVTVIGSNRMRLARGGLLTIVKGAIGETGTSVVGSLCGKISGDIGGKSVGRSSTEI